MLGARIRAFATDENGTTAIEYGLIAGLIAVAAIGSFTLFGNGVQALFNTPTAGVIANRAKLIP